MFDVITIGSASRDIFFTTEEARIIFDEQKKVSKKYIAFEYGSKIIPEGADFTYGGGGVNTAISFTKLGLKTAAIVRIGTEGTGSLVLKDLEEAGVDCRFVERDKKNHTALSVIVSIPGLDHTMFLYRGANNYLTIKDWRPIKTKWIYLSSLTGESSEIIPEIFSFARAHNISVAWNPGSEQLRGGYDDMSGYLEHTKILILNRSEATKLALSKSRSVRVNDEKELLKSLFEMTGNVVVITDSENGSYATDGKIDYFQPAISENVLETTGAGDAYGSTFVASTILGFGIKGAMKMSAINSGNVIKFIGAQRGLMTIDEVRSKINSGSKNEITSPL